MVVVVEIAPHLVRVVAQEVDRFAHFGDGVGRSLAGFTNEQQHQNKKNGLEPVDAALCDGDWVILRQQNVADNGDIVAAMIDGEATVKTFKRTAGQVWLMPHNPAFDPIPGNDAAVLGKVVTVIRKI